jgi:hypothetical protein
MPSKSDKSPRAVARAAERAAAAAAATAAEFKAVAKLSPEAMLINGFGIELGDTDEAVREKGAKKMLAWLKSQKEVSQMDMQKMSEPSPPPPPPKPSSAPLPPPPPAPPPSSSILNHEPISPPLSQLERPPLQLLDVRPPPRTARARAPQ